jgi:DNA-binding transcriptional regulator LsrR (DeoR family)
MARRKRKNRPLPGHLIYGVAERFIRQKNPATGRPWNADTLAQWLGEQGYPRSREQIYPILREAARRGYLKGSPPHSLGVHAVLEKRYPDMPADTRILDVMPPLVVENLATETAEVVFELIVSIAEGGGASRSRRKPYRRIHVGFGAGGTTRRVAECLAERLASEPKIPPITVHALSSGFAIERPLEAPIAFFSFFENLHEPVEFVSLYSPPAVECTEYEAIKKLPGVKRSFELKKKLDIVVTSLAQADDPHGLLNMYLGAEKAARRAELGRRGHVGDVQWQPYSKKGPLAVKTGHRVVTLFDLPDLVRLAAEPGKHVVLVAGPCIVCGKVKAKALRPLLTEPRLRVCNHLVTDVETGRKLLDLA